MKTWITALALSLFIAFATPALAGYSVIGLTYNEVTHSYGVTATPVGRGSESEDARVHRQLAALDDLCSRQDWRSVRQCNQAWRTINRAHAQLQAKKAAASNQ
jgi:hypothetical protein